MNDKLKNNNRDQEIAEKLRKVAEQTQARSQFAAELEERLRARRQPKAGRLATFLNQISSTVRWVALVILFGLVLNWSIKSLIPVLQPSTDMTPDGFVCPVTEPNGSRPPDAPSESPYYFGNGNLWTILSPNGKVYMFPEHRQPDGSYGSRWAFWRGVPGPLTIEGHRLDGEAEPLRAEIADGFGDTGIQGVGLFFPTAGCWEVTGRVGEVSLTFVTEVLLDVAPPTPDAVINETSTPVAEDGGFDWRGAKLHLNVPLPESPTEANVYMLQADEQATIEDAHALAQRFGIEGEVYQAPGELPHTTDYMITNGKQRLYVRSKNYFTYYADYNTNIILKGGKSIDLKAATTAITTFLKSHGFEDTYFIENAPRIPGNFYAIPYLPDGLTIRYDHNLPARLEFVVSDNAEILSVRSAEIDYEQIGTYGIRSAEEAFQQVLDSSESIQNGVLESVRSGGVLNESYWERSYLDNQMITLYGRVQRFESVDPNQPAFVAIEGYTAAGNIPSASPDQWIEATGQFYTDDGIRKFNIESWEVSDAVETSLMGTLQREGDQTVLLSDMGDRYVITDVPTDVPLNTVVPDEQLIVTGVLSNGNLVWSMIQYFPADSNYGGGGGGGTGFYKLNLSGTPVPFPSPTVQPAIHQGSGEYAVKEGDTLIMIAESFGITVDELMQANGLTDPMIFIGQTLVIPDAQSDPGITEYVVQANDTMASIASNFGISVDELRRANGIGENNIVFTGQTLFIPGQQEDNPIVGRRFEGQRGTLVISIHNQSDGNSLEEFTFVMKNEAGSLSYALLDDVSFEALLPYHHHPINIWGTVNRVNENGIPIISVKRYEALFPGLTFQLVQGTQQTIEIDGISATLFTSEDGKSYIQVLPDGSLDNSIIGNSGDKVYAEALIIPDELISEYPAMRVFSMGMAINPKNGEPATITITADQPYVLEEEATPEDYTPPAATIEKVDLVYYIPDPRYALSDSNAGPQYIQPAWRFYGHFSNGDEFEFLVQALKEEYLLSELAPYTPPG